MLKENTRPFVKGWGPDPQIAVVYAEGICAIDTGIKARTLAPLIESLAFDPFIKAVVLRVDSPGGSALACLPGYGSR